MHTIQILKNGEVIKTITCGRQEDFTSKIKEAYAIAESKANGIDIFSVKVI